VSAVLFFIAGIGAVAGAIGVVVLRDPFYAVLSLVGHLLFLAVLFLLLRAEFVAAAQVVVYAGAVMVLYVFVVAYVGEAQPLNGRLRAGGAGLRLGAAVFGAALLVELFIDHKGAPYVPGFGSPRFIGNLLLTKFLLTFEVASLLLLIVAVGAVVLARRRGGIEEGDIDSSPLHLARPRGTGTTAETVSSLAFAAAHDRPESFQTAGMARAGAARDDGGVSGDPTPAEDPAGASS
jgi:NADH-quinone oxidoreductase subunit J